MRSMQLALRCYSLLSCVVCAVACGVSACCVAQHGLPGIQGFLLWRSAEERLALLAQQGAHQQLQSLNGVILLAILQHAWLMYMPPARWHLTCQGLNASLLLHGVHQATD